MKLPLAGHRILVTRTREQGSTLAAALCALGADVLEVPTIRIAPPDSYAPLDAALARWHEFDMLVVSSANTAQVLASRLLLLDPALSRLRLPPGYPPGQPWTVAIGPATAAALREAGFRVDEQPMPAVAESVVRELAPRARGKHILLARAKVARDLVPDALRAAGATVEVVEAYQTLLAEDSRPVLQAEFAASAPPVAAVTFSSSSTVSNFFSLLGAEGARAALATARACSIGPVTSATLRGYGVEPAAEAVKHDVEGLVEVILQTLRQL